MGKNVYEVEGIDVMTSKEECCFRKTVFVEKNVWGRMLW